MERGLSGVISDCLIISFFCGDFGEKLGIFWGWDFGVLLPIL